MAPRTKTTKPTVSAPDRAIIADVIADVSAPEPQAPVARCPVDGKMNLPGERCPVCGRVETGVL